MAQKAVFGKPLDKLLENDRKKRPQWNVPYFIHEAVRCITRNGIDLEGIFRISGNKENVSKYQATFDKGEEIDFVKEKSVPHDVASLLKQYLRDLPDPLFTYAFYDKWIQAYEMPNREEQLQTIKNLVDALPLSNRALLSHLVPFFAIIASNSTINKMESGNLSKTIGPNLLWKEGKADSIEYLVNSSKINDILKILIDEHKYFFPDPFGGDETAKKWSRLDSKIFAHTKSIQALALGYESQQIWSCDSSGEIKIWDAQTHKLIKTIDSAQGRLFSMCRVGDRQIWTCSQGSAKIWDTKTLQCIKELPGFSYCAVQVPCFEKNEDHVWLGSDSVITVLNATSFAVEKKIDVARNVVTSLCLDQEGKFVWGSTTDRNTFIYIWNSQTGEQVQGLSKGHTKKVNSFTFSKNRMWSAGDDGAICVWDSTTFDLIKRLEGHAGPVYGINVFGEYAWSCSWDTTVRIWDTNSFECISVLNDFHSDCISSILAVFTPSDARWRAWTSSWDKSICNVLVNYQLPPPSSEPRHFANRVPVSPTASSSSTNPPNVEVTSSMSATSEASGFDGVTPSSSEESPADPEKIAQLLKRRDEIRARRKILDERKQELEAKKKALEDRKQELIQSYEKEASA